ncbi:hypothetical protein GCM10008107_14210 [Psychrosphaera saromensis]|uniref:metallophosphoesterase n=1 Tax=Psychrosphaera saromensis TaxID=716813 RepID=UPI000CF50E0A|nr:metallophosphoesterase [Psychrosphaera saromensis]GHB66219.1 hypothetical protein GCM10008107_14210 [Psychrosphaera saromensis]GLQ14877.1 hypothetical protein GCM10007917_23320 [Psychrosphaera saromensis]
MNKMILSSLLVASVLAGCGGNKETETTTKKDAKNIEFLAFGDGGYHPDYPKKKHIKNPRNKEEFIAKEKEDWLEDYRPIEEFDHAPIYMYPNTDIATEQTGASAVGNAMAEVCRTRECEFALQLGDNVYPDGADAKDGKDDQKRMDDLILKPLLPLLTENPDLVIYSALGNHDWKTSRKGVELQTNWMAEQPNFHLDKKGYYQYKMGEAGNDVEFFVLDTNMLLSAKPIYEIPLNPDGSEMELAEAKSKGIGELETPESHESPVHGEDIVQIDWLKAGLANSTAKWKIVYGHHILWSIGGSKYSEGHVLRERLMPMLCEYADAYIAGHEHDLELLTDDCSLYLADSTRPPLPLIISGAASKMRGKHTPFAQQQEKRYPEYDLLWSKSFVWGFAHIKLDNQADKLDVEFFTTPRDLSNKLVPEAKFSFDRRN